MLNNLPDINPTPTLLTVRNDLAVHHQVSALVKPVQGGEAVIAL